MEYAQNGEGEADEEGRTSFIITVRLFSSDSFSVARLHTCRRSTFFSKPVPAAPSIL